MDFEVLLKQPHALPAAPKVAMRVIRSFEADDVDLGEIADEIETDPALAARVLQQANSSLFRLMRPVATVQAAVSVLGLNKVRALVLAMSMNQSFQSVKALDLESFWRYSLCTATLARYVCQPLRLDENIAFTTGLLHGVGELVMHMAIPQLMEKMNLQTPLMSLDRTQRQYDLLGYCYAEVGAALAREWRLPRPLVEVIAQHARPLEADPPQPMAAVLHLASWRARIFIGNLSKESLIYTYPDAVGLHLGVDPDSLVTDDIPPLHGLL